jgi:hypothetical protein
VVLEDLVGRLGLVELKLVGEAGAAPADDADAEAVLGLGLGLEEVGQLGGGRLAKCDHSDLLCEYALDRRPAS